MTNEQMVAWLRSYAKLAVYLSEEEMINAIADRIEALQADNAKMRDALFPFAEFHQLGGSMNDPISMWFRVAPFADAAYALQETER